MENSLLNYGDNVVLGVSGGADSTTLLLTLNELKEKYNLKLFVVHVNHMLREEAFAEAEYVKGLCEERGIEYFYFEEDVAALAEMLSMGTEEAGRMVRYASFNEIADSVGGAKIAIAHNKNDLTETMLFNLFRGTGVKGLASIPPVRGNIVRPLLCVERYEIEAFLNEAGVSYCTDKSNMSDEYSRNRLRNNVIPVIKENVTENAIDHMAETAAQLRELYAFSEKCCDEAFKKANILKTEATVKYNKAAFLNEDIYVQKMLVKRAIDELVPNNKDITHLHLESVIEICSKPGTKRVNLPYGIIAIADYDTLKLTTIPPEMEAVRNYNMETVVESYHEGYDYGDDEYTKCFDYDKIKGPLMLRTRRRGDEIAVTKDGGRKKLKDYFIDVKVPADERDRVPVLCTDSDVLWVIGYRMSEAYKLDKDTKRVLRVTVSKEEIHE